MQFTGSAAEMQAVYPSLLELVEIVMSSDMVPFLKTVRRADGNMFSYSTVVTASNWELVPIGCIDKVAHELLFATRCTVVCGNVVLFTLLYSSASTIAIPFKYSILVEFQISIARSTNSPAGSNVHIVILISACLNATRGHAYVVLVVHAHQRAGS